MRHLPFVFFTLLSTMPTSAAPAQRDLGAQAEEALCWLDGLGFPDVADCPFVEITVRSKREDGGRSAYGFLIARDSDGFTIFTLDLKRMRCTAETTHSRRSLPQFASDCLKYVLPPGQETSDNHPLVSATRGLGHADFESDLTDKTLLTVLAWACGKNGLVRLQESLIVRAFELAPSRYMRYSPNSLAKCIKDDISFVLAARIPWRLDDRNVPLQSVIAEVEWCLKHFPDHRYHKRLGLRKHLQTLRRMVSEDRTHDYSRPLAFMPEAEQIAELVYRLRDQDGQMVSSPLAQDDVLFDPRGDKAPASQILTLGPRAVPYLLPEVCNDTLTRSVGRDMKMTAPSIATVGDVVQQIILTIVRDELPEAEVDRKTRDDIRSSFFDIVWDDTKKGSRVCRLNEWWDNVSATISNRRSGKN